MIKYKLFLNFNKNQNILIAFIMMLLVVFDFKPVNAQTDNPVIFRDDFTRIELGTNWYAPFSWSIVLGSAYNFISGTGGELKTAQSFDAPSYVIETVGRGFTNNYHREFRITFGQDKLSTVNTEDSDSTYVLSYTPYSGGQLTLAKSTGNIYDAQKLDEISVFPDLETNRWYKFKIARYKSGLIQVYLDRGRGYSTIPVLEAIDTTYKRLGHFGWQIDTQTAAESFYVDWIEAREPEVEKPAEREKPAEDNLITQVTTRNHKAYPVSKLNIGVKQYSDTTTTITSLPAYLKGASFIQTAAKDSKDTSSAFLTMFFKKAVIVYVAFDPKASSIPAWLRDWRKTGDIIGTDDPENSYLDIYSKLVESPFIYPEPFQLGGNSASPAKGDHVNYLVAAVERPNIVKYEAEDATLHGARVAINHLGYSGTGFVDYINRTGDYIEWTIQIATPGSYSLGLYFSNGREYERPLHFTVDGVGLVTNNFITTDSWDSWAFYGSPRVFLTQGTHKVRATAIGLSGPNVDYLNVSYFSAIPEITMNQRNGTAKDLEIKEIGKQHAAYPNPFADNTTITYSTTEKAPVTVSVYTLQGQTVKVLVNKTQEPGQHEVALDGASLSKGIYLYRVQSGKQVYVGKIIKQ